MVSLEIATMGCFFWAHGFGTAPTMTPCRIGISFVSFPGNDNTVWERELANVPVHSIVQEPIPLVPGTRSVPIRASAVGSLCAWASRSRMGPVSGSQGCDITTTVASW